MRKFISLAIILTISSALHLRADLNNPITRAVLDVYSQQLKETPEDYHIWLNRANEYYRNNEYMRALNDVNNAIKFCPTKEIPDRIMALMLRANIYIQTDRPQEALADLDMVLSLDNQHYVALYQHANTNYTLGNYTLAKADYQRLLRLNPRSPEGLVGMARVAVKENNLGLANEYLDQALNNDQGNSELYVRRASVRRDMGNDQGAVDDLIMALAVDSRNNRAILMLVDYGKVNYPAVMAGLTNAMTQAPAVSMYPYIRAVIAQHHYHYKAALGDYRMIIDKKLENYQGIWRSMAECRYALGQFDKALEDVDHALALDPNAGEAVLLRAAILRALGRLDEAKALAAQAVILLPGKVAPLNEMGLVYVSLKNYSEAAGLFAEATMLAGATTEAPRSLLLRAWMLGTYLNQPVAAKGFYEKIADIATEYPDNKEMQIYAQFGRCYAGLQTEATAEIDRMAVENVDSPYLQYLCACFYAQTGNFDAALKCTENSLKSGYANYYDWMYCDDARVNVAPLRDDLRFLNLLEQYKHLWTD